MVKKKDDFDIFEELEEKTEPQNEADGLEGFENAEEEPTDVQKIDDDPLEMEPQPVADEPPESTEQQPGQPMSDFAEDMAQLSPDIPVNLAAVIGKVKISVGDLMNYRIGRVIDLGRTPSEIVDVVANGRLIAKGELVEIDGKLGVKILKMVK